MGANSLRELSLSEGCSLFAICALFTPPLFALMMLIIKLNLRIIEITSKMLL